MAIIFASMALTSALAHSYTVMLVAWFIMGIIHPICGVVYVKGKSCGSTVAQRFSSRPYEMETILIEELLPHQLPLMDFLQT